MNQADGNGVFQNSNYHFGLVIEEIFRLLFINIIEILCLIQLLK